MSVTSTLTQPLPASQKLREVHHWINGQTALGTSGRFGDVYNPASGEVQARVALATQAEVDTAIAAASGSAELAWPTEQRKGPPKELGRTQHALIAFLRRVWKPFIEDNKVLVTREILKEKDPQQRRRLKDTFIVTRCLHSLDHERRPQAIKPSFLSPGFP